MLRKEANILSAFMAIYVTLLLIISYSSIHAMEKAFNSRLTRMEEQFQLHLIRLNSEARELYGSYRERMATEPLTAEEAFNNGYIEGQRHATETFTHELKEQ